MVIDIPDWKTAIDEAIQIHLPRADPKPRTFEEVARVMGAALELLLISKNQKYGKGNILNATQFGMQPKQGLALRMNDKFERLKNGLQGKDLGAEGFIESFGDICGYAAIGIMLERNWYQIPLEEDVNAKSKG